jgi:hypothetical protein
VPDTWRKATFSGAQNCVEVARLGPNAIGVRHSRDPNGSTLVYTSAEWEAFLAGARAGEFDDLAP